MRITYVRTRSDAFRIMAKYLKIGRMVKMRRVKDYYELKIYARGQK